MSEYRYGQETAEKIKFDKIITDYANNLKNANDTAYKNLGKIMPNIHNINAESYQRGYLDALNYFTERMTDVLKRHTEYRNHAPLKDFQHELGFDVQAWIDGGKK